MRAVAHGSHFVNGDGVAFVFDVRDVDGWPQQRAGSGDAQRALVRLRPLQVEATTSAAKMTALMRGGV